ncbi:MAG: FMN-binding protein [Candidatus Saccharimonadales bacterium]
MKKVALSAFVIVSFLLYSLGIRNSYSSLLVSPKTSTAGGGTTGQSGPTASSSGSSPGSTGSASSSSAKYKDGTYTGSVADAFYGNIQVQATIQGGKITGVKFLQYPNDRPNSVAINQQAMPYLQQEAIQAQSANVDGVSGATDTSIAFKQSLSAALSQAM